MGKASFSVIAACKTIERPAGLHCDFVCRQFLIQRIFYNDMPIFDFSFPFHSFPVPSFLVLSREQAQQMSTHLPFLACWEFPKPFCVLSLNIPFGNPLLLLFSLILDAKNCSRFFVYNRSCKLTTLNQSCIINKIQRKGWYDVVREVLH